MNHYEKIKFEWLGKYRMTSNIYGKIKTYVMKCPICRAETTFFRRKGVLKISCDVCPYELITGISAWVKQSVDINQLERDLHDFFIDVLDNVV